MAVAKRAKADTASTSAQETRLAYVAKDGTPRSIPTWVKLIDFETTLPSAVAELARQRDERQRT